MLQIAVQKLQLSQNRCLAYYADLDMSTWRECPFRAHKSVFLLQEPLIPLNSSFSRTVQVFTWGKWSEFQGRISKLKFWSCILAPRSWFCFPSWFTLVLLLSTNILRLRLHLLPTNHMGMSSAALTAHNGSEILSSCFMAFWETQFYSSFLCASLVAPWPPSEDLRRCDPVHGRA